MASDSARQHVVASPWMLLNFVICVCTFLEYTSCFHKQKHGLLASYTTRKVCFLTTNYGYHELAELQVGKFIFWPQNLRVIMATCRAHRNLFSYHNSWPFLVAELQNILLRWRRPYLLVVEGCGSKHMQRCRSHTHFQSMRRTRNCVHALICPNCVCWVGEG